MKTGYNGTVPNKYYSLYNFKEMGDMGKDPENIALKKKMDEFYESKGFHIKMEGKKEVSGGTEEMDMGTWFKKVMLSPPGLKMEGGSFNVHASASALGKLGAFMANKGSFKGKTLISEETWNDLHSDLKMTDKPLMY